MGKVLGGMTDALAQAFILLIIGIILGFDIVLVAIGTWAFNRMKL
jgi:hypothetical protein